MSQHSTRKAQRSSSLFLFRHEVFVLSGAVVAEYRIRRSRGFNFCDDEGFDHCSSYVDRSIDLYVHNLHKHDVNHNKHQHFYQFV